MAKTCILVTGIGGGGNGEQILKALRLARNPEYLIVGTDISDYSAGQRFVDIFCKVPPAGDPSYLREIMDIIDRYGVDFIFHGSEPELQFISQNRHTLRAMGVKFYINSTELIRLCSNKIKTYQRLQALGFPVPRFLEIKQPADINAIDFYPVVLKPYVGSGGSSNVFIALDRDEAHLLASYMLKIGVKVVAQEYLASHEEEYTIGVSSDEIGNVLGSIVVKKIIGNAMSIRLKVSRNGTMYVISSGFSQGEVCHMPELQKQAEAMARALKSKGPLNIQCRLVDGTLMLMEINPRTSGTTSLRAMAGYNEPEMIINHYLNNEKWSGHYDNMTILRGLEEYCCRPKQVSITIPASPSLHTEIPQLKIDEIVPAVEQVDPAVIDITPLLAMAPAASVSPGLSVLEMAPTEKEAQV